MVKYFITYTLFVVLGITQNTFAYSATQQKGYTCNLCCEVVIDTGKTEFNHPADTAKQATEQYNKGFQDGFNNYQPNAERIVGVSVLLLPMVSLPGCIYYSFKKVSEKNIPDSRYQTNSNVNYRTGYVAGASKRRRVAAWSCFGGAVGVFAGAGTVVGLLYAGGNGQ
jgi:hypothetical protein